MIRQHAKPTLRKQPWLISRTYIVPIVFVFAFAGIGVSLLFGSNAQTSCAKQTILVGQHGGCVQDVQEILNTTANDWGGTSLTVNGRFDSPTQTELERFQNAHVAHAGMFTGDTSTSIVDSGTWQALCYADNIWQGSEAAFMNAGCQSAFGVVWGGSYSTAP